MKRDYILYAVAGKYKITIYRYFNHCISTEPVWKCYVADGRARDMKCNAISYREDSIEHAFMSSLLYLKKRIKEMDAEVGKSINDKSLDDYEMKELDLLENEIRLLEEQQNQLGGTAVNDRNTDLFDDNMSFHLSLEIENGRKSWTYSMKKRTMY